MVDRNEARKELARRELARRRASQSGAEAEAQLNLQALGGSLQAPDPNDKSYTGTILPVSYDREGNMSFDSNAGLLGALKSAVTAPGRAMSGELQVRGPDGRTSPAAIAEAANVAGVVSPSTPGLRSGERLIAGQGSTVGRAEVDAPTPEMLKEAARIDYEKMRGLGVDYSTKAVNSMADETQVLLNQDGITPSLAPKTYSILTDLQQAPEGSVASVSGLEAARRAFGNAAKDFANPTEQLAAKRAIESLDGFLARSDPASVVSGPADQVAPLLATARGNYAAAKRSQTLSDITRNAEYRANAANSGTNVGNTTRQRLADLLISDKRRAQFGAEDIANLEGVNKGSTAANITRRIGNMLGGGGGLGAALLGFGGATAGAMTGNSGLTAVGASLPLAGIASRELSNILTERALRAANDSTRKRSPLYQQMVDQAPLVTNREVSAEALARALLASGAGIQNSGGGW